MDSHVMTPVGIEQTLLTLRMRNQGVNVHVDGGLTSEVREHALVKEALEVIDALPIEQRAAVYQLAEKLSALMKSRVGLLSYSLVGAIFTAVSEADKR